MADLTGSVMVASNTEADAQLTDIWSRDRTGQGVNIVAYQPGHRDQVVASLRAVRAAGGTYPPPYIDDTAAAITEWLERYPATVRLVAVTGSTVVGHVQLVPAEATDPDLPAALHRAGIDTTAVVELARLFVTPPARGRGVGRALFDAATSAAADLGLRPALCVLVTQHEAVALYRAAGWVELDSFVGVSGVENLVFVAPN